MTKRKDKADYIKTGRPSKYKPEYCDLTAYFQGCEDNNDQIPKICGFAIFLGVTENTVMNWGKEFPDFLRSLKKILAKQKQMLMDKGLDKTYSSVIAKLLLSANHGIKETVNLQNNGGSFSYSVAMPEGFVPKNIKVGEGNGE